VKTFLEFSFQSSTSTGKCHTFEAIAEFLFLNRLHFLSVCAFRFNWHFPWWASLSFSRLNAQLWRNSLWCGWNRVWSLSISKANRIDEKKICIQETKLFFLPVLLTFAFIFFFFFILKKLHHEIYQSIQYIFFFCGEQQGKICWVEWKVCRLRKF